MAGILGLDLSTCTGFAFWDTARHFSSIEAGVVELQSAKDAHDDWRVAQMGIKTSNLIKQYRPDFVLIEERLRFSKSGDKAFAMSNAIHGAVLSHLCSWNMLFGVIPVRSWHAAAYGEKFTRPLVEERDRNGNQKRDNAGKPLFKQKDWKQVAVEKCEQLGIALPGKKTVAHNAAEAAIIAMCWRCHNRITVPSKRDHARYIALLQGHAHENRAKSLGLDPRVKPQGDGVRGGFGGMPTEMARPNAQGHRPTGAPAPRASAPSGVQGEARCAREDKAKPKQGKGEAA
jgi:cytochrome c553